MHPANDPADESMRVIEGAMSAILSWAARHDVHEETMRRARCDLPPAHAWLLSRLSTCGPLRMGELALILGIDSSTITPQAQRLERDGLVARKPDPSDGRAVLLTVTRAGLALLSRLRTSRRAVLIEKLGDWPEADRCAAAAALSQLAAALNPG